MKYLNLGCGYRFHPEWTNVDFKSTGKGVIACNLTQGIPFPDDSFDVVYHCHILEHFSKSYADKFLKECFRVLKKDGIIRIAVPDLEKIAQIYLTALEKAEKGSEEWARNYEWILLEMYDQTVRNVFGGEMSTYIAQDPIPNYNFLFERWGLEVKRIKEEIREQNLKNNSKEKLSQKHKFLEDFFIKINQYPKSLKETLIKIILGKDYQALEIGRFRLSGEIHQWMYDRYSLSSLLKKCGFEQIVQRSAYESYIANWTSFNLDTYPDGAVYRPDSLFMEAVKPSLS